MSTVLTNGIIIPDNGSRNWGGDLANNWNILDVHVGYMTDVKNRVTTLESSVAENTANIQINTSSISTLQTSKQDKIEDLETIRAGASAGATAVQPSALSNYVDLNSEQTISGAKTFSSVVLGEQLGTSSNKWKTFNGINPGALSLPSDTSVKIDTTSFEWGKNFTFNAAVNGHLFINAGNSSGTRSLSLKTSRGEYYITNQRGFMRFTIPIYENKVVTVLITSSITETVIPTITLFTCQGNV